MNINVERGIVKTLSRLQCTLGLKGVSQCKAASLTSLFTTQIHTPIYFFIFVVSGWLGCIIIPRADTCGGILDCFCGSRRAAVTSGKQYWL